METAEKQPAKHIGRKIARIRELRGMKQEVLAMEMGLSQEMISKIEQSETWKMRHWIGWRRRWG